MGYAMSVGQGKIECKDLLDYLQLAAESPDDTRPQQRQQPPRRQILQLVCTHKGPVTALLGPASNRVLLDPKARRASQRTASTDDHPNASVPKPEAQLEQIFTGGHDGIIRVWETSRLGVMSRRLTACASLVQVSPS